MNSRERFRLAINHKEPDRVPIDIGGDMHNGISEVAYRNLLEYLGEEDDVKLYDVIQHLATVKPSVYERLHSDTRYIFANPASGFERIVGPDTGWYDEWGVKRINAGLYDDAVETPLADCTFEKIKNYRLPDPKDKGRFAGLREKAKDLYENTDYAIIGGSAASLFYLSSEIVGYQEFMEKILLETEMMEKLIDRVLEWQLDFFDCYLEEIGPYVEMVWMGDDWGTQRGPLMGPDLFRSVFKPRYKVLTESIKKKADVKIALHSCGSVEWALDDFPECGIDVLHPLQGDAKGMGNPIELKKRYGDKLVFYSNLCNQTTIPYGTPEEVRQQVYERIQALAPGGGYIMSGGHNFQADVPPENLLAIVDETLKSGNYPIGE